MSIVLRGVDEPYRDQRWELSLRGPNSELRDARGRLVAVYPRGSLLRLAQFPDPARAIRYLTLRIGGDRRRFDMELHSEDLLRDHVNRLSILMRTARSVRGSAIRDTVAGLACIVGGGIATARSAHAAAEALAATGDAAAGRFNIFYGLVAVGALMLVKGAFGFARYGRVMKSGR